MKVLRKSRFIKQEDLNFLKEQKELYFKGDLKLKVFFDYLERLYQVEKDFLSFEKDYKKIKLLLDKEQINFKEIKEKYNELLFSNKVYPSVINYSINIYKDYYLKNYFKEFEKFINNKLMIISNLYDSFQDDFEINYKKAQEKDINYNIKQLNIKEEEIKLKYHTYSLINTMKKYALDYQRYKDYENSLLAEESKKGFRLLHKALKKQNIIYKEQEDGTLRYKKTA